MSADPVVGVVLAAGRSKRLGVPKQLLPYRDTTLLGATLEAARQCGFDQLVVTLGAAEALVREKVPMDDVDVVVTDDAASGCSASLRAALDRVQPLARGIVLMPADQPGVQPAVIARLVASGRGRPIAVCRYRDGIGHPFWLGRSIFGDLRSLHGDKAVWKLIESGCHPITELVVDATVPPDVDTWGDYQRLLAAVMP